MTSLIEKFVYLFSFFLASSLPISGSQPRFHNRFTWELQTNKCLDIILDQLGQNLWGQSLRLVFVFNNLPQVIASKVESLSFA